MTHQTPQLNSFALDTREDLIVNAIEIFDTIKQSLMVLDRNLIVVMANSSFYKTFQVTKQETEGRVIYDVGNGQWNIDKLKVLLEKIIPQSKAVEDYEVTHKFDHIGLKVMLLNAREIVRQDNRQEMILVAIEDITYNKFLEQQTKDAQADIQTILEKLVGSTERYSGGTAPQSSAHG